MREEKASIYMASVSVNKAGTKGRGGLIPTYCAKFRGLVELRMPYMEPGYDRCQMTSGTESKTSRSSGEFRSREMLSAKS